jgi:site-specific DNA-methyltransferase (cytosine-N4-specific)
LIWSKNSSRVSESTSRRWHTDFEYVYWFVKDAAQYYFDPDAIRVPYLTDESCDKRPPRHISGKTNEILQGDPNSTVAINEPSLRHAGGRLPGCVLDISRHVPPPTETSSPVRHTAVMPPRLVREILKPIAQVGDILLDPFSGSATTGAVALEMGCFYVGYDVSPVFQGIGAKRLQDVKEKLSNS